MAFDITPYVDMSPKKVRELIRKGVIDFPTAGMCRGYAQANMDAGISSMTASISIVRNEILFLFIKCTSFFILTILLFLPFQTIRRIIVKNRVNYSSFCRTIIYPVFHLFLFHFTAASASGILPVCILLPE